MCIRGSKKRFQIRIRYPVSSIQYPTLNTYKYGYRLREAAKKVPQLMESPLRGMGIKFFSGRANKALPQINYLFYGSPKENHFFCWLL